MSPGFWWIFLAFGLYSVVHSILASLGVKALACRLGGTSARRFYRLGYNLFAVLSLVPVMALVAFLPDRTIYTIAPPWRWLFLAGQGLALFGLASSFLQIDMGAFAGLSQLFGRYDTLCSPEGRSPSGALVTKGLYRFIRHPLYSFGLLLIWLSPHQTWNSLAFNLGITLYLIIGAKVEERKLLVEFPEYAEYQRHTPMFIPGLRWG